QEGHRHHAGAPVRRAHPHRAVVRAPGADHARGGERRRAAGRSRAAGPAPASGGRRRPGAGAAARPGSRPRGPGGAVAPAAARALSVEVGTDERGFAELAGEWRRLYGACRSVTPFQSHAWLHSWWLSYGTEDGLRLVLVRRHGELVAAAPLMRVHR